MFGKRRVSDLMWHLTPAAMKDGGKLAFPLSVENACVISITLKLLHTCMHVGALRRGFRCLSGGI